MGQSTWTTHFIYLHGPDSLSPIIAGILAAGIAIQIQPHLTEAFNLVPVLSESTPCSRLEATPSPGYDPMTQLSGT